MRRTPGTTRWCNAVDARCKTANAQCCGGARGIGGNTRRRTNANGSLQRRTVQRTTVSRRAH
eukprot:9574639-Lingulodinium_polyedra.AAC.1